MYPEHEPERARGYDAHEFEVEAIDQGAGVYGGGERAEYADFIAEGGELLFCEREEGEGCALAVCNEPETREGGEREDGVYEGGEVEDAHLTDVPGPHARVAGGEGGVRGVEAAAVVAEEDIISTVSAVRGCAAGMVVGGDAIW